jgi:hypothetical protein
MDPRPDIFISYTRKDGEALAGGVRRRLSREHPELRPWQDRTDRRARSKAIPVWSLR